MPKIHKIYLDMDGVICDFNKKFTEMFGMSPKTSDARKSFEENFKQAIDNKIFEDLDPMHDAFDLIRYLNSTGIPVEILSSTARDYVHDKVSFQKGKWLDNQRIFYPRNFVPGKQHKPKYADEHSVLIDDTYSIIEAWNKKGGIGIHHTDALTTISILNTLVNP